ncbi:MAG: FAD-dependent oxidoreductase, partial [Kiloniellales bacterium]|nr:FAD-dependent oxidoreductase [Kiloniellales bacterium]
APKGSDDQVLIVGAGPAGLECARALGRRGYGVILAEAEAELGGRVSLECRLPGLAAWGRVRDYRLQQLHQMPNVALYPASRLSADDVREFGFPRVVLATGCRWRGDGFGRAHHRPIPGCEQAHVVAPEAVMAGGEIAGPVVIYDDDHFYLGGVLAEKLRAEGREVTIATPALQVSQWTDNTLEQRHVQRRLVSLGVEIATQRRLEAIGAGEVELSCLVTGRRETRPAASVVLVTARLPEDALYRDLMAAPEALAAAGIASVARIGDCLAPATIAAAVYAGHRYARELDAPAPQGAPFARELAALAPD